MNANVGSSEAAKSDESLSVTVTVTMLRFRGGNYQ